MLKPILFLFAGIVLLNTGYGQVKRDSARVLPGNIRGTDTSGVFNPDSVPGKRKQDSTGTFLPGITIKAYEQYRPLTEVAAPVSVITPAESGRYGNTSLLPAINASAGARMEERSPGSYRLNIRGSSLRSPFGVRNIKIYLNGIPFTDPGGNTYLNQLSFFDIAGMEIIRGPGSSLYGAGTGGVMLLSTMKDSADNNLMINYSTGSYHSNNLNLNASFDNKDLQNKVSYTHQQTNGYRDQSYMRRDVASWQTVIRKDEKQSLSAYVLYGDLYYETPGGLTKAQYLENPRAARPASGSFPGAEDNRAGIYQKTFWTGLQQHYRFNEHLENSTSVYGAFSQIKNPAVLNYERRSEPHFGGRTSFSWSAMLDETALKITAGAEFQQGFSSVKVYKNNKGNPDSLQTDDEVNNRLASIFMQAGLSFTKGWIATAGISVNKNPVRFTRLSEVPSFNYKADFNNEWAPRVSLLKKLNNRLSLYGVVSKGFSPPTVAELLPSTSVINTTLEAEQGINYELGFRGSFFRNRLDLDINTYYFGLKKAITQRRDQSGADYFVNAGNTRQEGIESSLHYRFLLAENSFITGASIWLSHTFTHFRYKQFKQEDNDFTGNEIPGVAPHTLAGGIDLATRPGLYLNLTWFYSSSIALDDANSAYADAYNLPGFRAGYKRHWGRRLIADLFLSGDNLLNKSYSLGNDINAAGSRFYNPAPLANFQAGAVFEL